MISQLLGLEIQFLQGGWCGYAEAEVMEATRRATTKEVNRAISNLWCFSYELGSWASVEWIAGSSRCRELSSNWLA